MEIHTINAAASCGFLATQGTLAFLVGAALLPSFMISVMNRTGLCHASHLSRFCDTF